MTMKRRLGVAVLALATAALPLSADAAVVAHGTADMGMGMGTVKVSTMAGGYKLTLIIGPMEQMYTQAQYKKMHPKKGEIMLRGTMNMGGMGMGMGMHAPNRHLELHVMDLKTMRPVGDAMVSISYGPVVAMGQMAMKPTKVSIAVMEGIGMGMSDIHYGNNVYMAHGQYHVWAHVNRVRAAFVVKL